MADNETIADIIAEMFDRADKLEHNKLGQVFADSFAKLHREYASRVDAAAKRMEWAHKKELEARDAVIQTEVAAREAERDAHKRENDELKKQVGDAAKLREAAQKTNATLEEALEILNEISDEEAGKLNARIEDVADAICEVTQQIIPDALAAPPRNCDRFATANEADAAYRRFYEREIAKIPMDSVNFGREMEKIPTKDKWLFAPATEQEGGNDADK